MGGPDNYTVVLNVTDAAGNWDTDSLVTTSVPAGPTDVTPPVAVAGPDLIIHEGDNVTLDGTNSTDDVGIWSYEWTFLYDGKTVQLNGSKVPFTFDLPGSYRVTLVVRDRWGNHAMDFLFILVLDTQPPVVVAGPDITVDMGEDFTLDSVGSWDNGIIHILKWTIDPDNLNLTFTGASVRTSIAIPGVYVVRLYIEDAAGQGDIDTFVTLRSICFVQ